MIYFLLFLLLIVLIFGLSFVFGIFNFVLTIFRTIFGFGRKPRNTTPQTPTPKKKENILFDKNEAEDTEYEEIK